MDEDAREVRILKEMFIEEEEDGQTRERKFRWKNVDGTLDMSATPGAIEEPAGENSDEENEEEWRKLRYEREQMLLKQNDGKNLPATAEVVEESVNEAVTNPSLSICRKTISKTVKTTSSTATSPFLLSLNGSGLAGRKSFLNRDVQTLEKLASLTKSSSDEVISKTNKKNYIFVAAEKPSVSFNPKGVFFRYSVTTNFIYFLQFSNRTKGDLMTTTVWNRVRKTNQKNKS